MKMKTNTQPSSARPQLPAVAHTEGSEGGIASEAIDSLTPSETRSTYNPAAAPAWKGLVKGLMFMAHKTKVQGSENLHLSGAHLYALTHQSYLDAPTSLCAFPGAIHFMAAKEEFTGIIGQAMADMGAFPVERGGVNASKAIQVGIDLIDQGHSVGLYPEGKIHGNSTEVHQLKSGAARIGLSSKAETLVPVAMHFTKAKSTALGTTAAVGTAAALAAGGVAVAMLGGPVALAVAGVVTGAVSGLAVGGAAGALLAGKEATLKERGNGLLKGGVLGMVAGAGAGLMAPFLAQPLALLGVTSGITGLVGAVAAWQIARRGEARISIGEAIPLAPYREQSDELETRHQLTEDLHGALSQLKAGIV